MSVITTCTTCGATMDISIVEALATRERTCTPCRIARTEPRPTRDEFYDALAALTGALSGMTHLIPDCYKDTRDAIRDAQNKATALLGREMRSRVADAHAEHSRGKPQTPRGWESVEGVPATDHTECDCHARKLKAAYGQVPERLKPLDVLA